MTKTIKIMIGLATVALLTTTLATAVSNSDANANLSPPDVVITVDDQGTARLTGLVDSQIAKELLENDAENLDGVERVVNQLSVVQ